jgi:replication factor A1
VLFQQAQVRESKTGKEMHLGDQTKLVKNPQGIAIGEVAGLTQRKKINELTENDNGVEIVGTIVQVFDPKFFEVCPTCNKRAKPDASGQAACSEHGTVKPAYGMVSNAFVDDGSGNIRVVFFRNQLERLTKKSTEELLAYREAPERFEDIKTELLGTMVKVTGRASRNQFFDRVEFIAQLVKEANPEEELRGLSSKT